MNPHKHTHADDATAPRARRRWKIAAALAVAVGAVCTSFASGVPVMHGHHGHGSMSPAAMQAHIDKMVEQCAADASPDQRARLTAIANAFVTDVRPAHEQFRESHAQAHALLMAPVVDRMALERWRAEQMQRMDAISRRVLSAVEDGADVLTPEQRARCASRLGSLMH
jgi:protein CpxP